MNRDWLSVWYWSGRVGAIFFAGPVVFVLLLSMIWAVPLARAETLDEVMTRHLKALGGEKALANISTVVLRGSLTQGENTFEGTWSAVAPTLFREDLALGDVTWTLATDGKNAWKRLGNGVSVGLRDQERDLARVLALVVARTYLHPDEADLSLDEPVAQGDDLLSVKVRGTDIPSTTLTFSHKTWHLVRVEASLAPLRLTLELDDYRKVSKARFPFHIVRKIDGDGLSSEETFSVREIDTGSELETDKFERTYPELRSFSFAEGADRSTVPLDKSKVDQGALIQVSVNGLEPAWWLLDSTSPSSVVSAALASKAGAKPLATRVAMDGGRLESRDLVRIDKISIGGLELKVVLARTGDLAQVGERVGQEIGGVLGLDLFETLVVEIKYAGGQLTFYDPRNYTDAGIGEALPIDHLGRVDALVNHQALLSVVLNTASDATIELTSKDIEHEHLAPPEARRQSLSVGEISPGQPYIGLLESVQLGQIGVASVPALFPAESDKQQEGRAGKASEIGSRLLELFDVTFDFPRRQVILARGLDFSRPFPFNRSGLTLAAGNTTTVKAVAPGYEQGIQVGDTLIAVMTDSGWSNDRAIIDARLREGAGTQIKVKIRRGRKVQIKNLVLKDP